MALSYLIQRLAPAVWFFFLSLLSICDLGLANPVDHAKKLSAEGIELARQNRINEAIDKFNRAVETNPRDGETYIYLANAYLQVSNLDAAEVACQQAKQFLLPQTAESYATMAQIRYRQGALEAAQEQYNQAINLDSDVAEYHHDLANVYHGLGQFKAAEKEYLATLNLSPDLPSVYHNLGEIYHLEGKLDQAIEAYQRSLSYSGEAPSTEKRLNEAVQKKQELISREILQNQLAIVKNPDNAQRYRELALSYYRARQLEDALESLQVAAHLEPDSQQIRHDIESLLQQKKDSLEAIRRNRLKRLEDEPQNPDCHYDLGLIYFNQDQSEKAEQHFRIALESAPNAVIIWLNLGRLLKNKGQDTAARQALLKCIEFDPDLPSAYQHLAILEKVSANYDLAVTYLLKAKSILQSYQVEHNSPLPVKSRSDLAFVNFHLGEIYLHQKRVKDATTAYHTAIRLKPDNPLSYLGLAELYQYIGNEGSARNFYHRFLVLARPHQNLSSEIDRAEKTLEHAIDQ